ncbi:RHS repeat-associated core domain-containing protein, partial [Symmachiella dynata]|uniref:RHS repeat-associated core domain-containing protein n=1 Tax=Symmachiella dynata TaxID=2527995 RepID=UPI003C6F7578
NLYDAWGVNVASSGTTENPFRYVGQLGYYFDAEASDYYIRARVYQPTIGRWLSVDPLGFTYLTHRYVYASNLPTTSVDSSGLYTLRQARGIAYRRLCKGPQLGSCRAWFNKQWTEEKEFKYWLEVESEALAKTPNWTKDLPKCPCKICKRNGVWVSPDLAVWDAPHPFPWKGGLFHPGADLEIRTLESNSYGAGNQCTYKILGQSGTVTVTTRDPFEPSQDPSKLMLLCEDTASLIQSGHGAGTADRVSPNVPGLKLAENLFLSAGHIGHDVEPFELAYKLDGSLHKSGGFVDKYITVRPPIIDVNCDQPPPTKVRRCRPSLQSPQSMIDGFWRSVTGCDPEYR